LSFAVVTEIGSFQHSRCAKSSKTISCLLLAAYDTKRDVRISVGSQKLFFALAILANVKDLRPRMDWFFLGEPVDHRRRDIFKFERDDIDRSNKLLQCGFIGIRSSKFPVRDLTCWAIRCGFIGMNSVPHSSGGDTEHSAELAAAEDTNGRSRTNAVPHRNNRTNLKRVF